MLEGLTGCAPENGTAAQGGGERPAATASPTAAPAPAPTGETQLVLAFGDSLYAGHGLPAKDSFPAQLERALVAQGIPATVRNAGVSGDTTAAGRRRLAFALDGLEQKPALAMVNLGGNDMLRGIDPAETRANLTAICDELKRRGIPILLTGMIAAPNMGRDYAAKFNAIYPDLAARYDARLYPFFLDGVITDRTLMLPDRVHPNAEGIAAITSRIAPVVAETLKDVAAREG